MQRLRSPGIAWRKLPLCFRHGWREDVSSLTPMVSFKHDTRRYQSCHIPVDYLVEMSAYDPKEWAIWLTWLATARTLVSGTNESMISFFKSSQLNLKSLSSISYMDVAMTLCGGSGGMIYRNSSYLIGSENRVRYQRERNELDLIVLFNMCL